MFAREKDYRYHKKGCHPQCCTDCGQYFADQRALTTHIALVHTKEFHCKICDKVFANKRNLKRHEDVHTGIKFQCQACHSEFSTKASMQRHMKKQH